MKVQHLFFHIDELKALTELYAQVAAQHAKGTAMRDALAEQGDRTPEEMEQLTSTIAELQRRHEAVERTLRERTRAADIDAAIQVVREQLGRRNHFEQLRQEQTALKVALELEVTIGAMDPGHRREAEATLANLQQRLETLVATAEAATLPRITLV